MYERRVSLAETRWVMGESFTARGDYYVAPIADSDHFFAFPQTLPLNCDNEPMWPDCTINTFNPAFTPVKTQNAARDAFWEAGQPYGDIKQMILWTGCYSDNTFYWTAPGEADVVLVQMVWDPARPPASRYLNLDDSDNDFARLHNAKWSYRAIADDDPNEKPCGYDFWIIQISDALRQALQRCQAVYQAKLDLAAEVLSHYDQSKAFYRRCIVELAEQCFDCLGWGLVPHEDLAEFYYIDGDGAACACDLRYDEHTYDDLIGLFCLAEEADAGGHCL